MAFRIQKRILPGQSRGSARLPLHDTERNRVHITTHETERLERIIQVRFPMSDSFAGPLGISFASDRAKPPHHFAHETPGRRCDHGTRLKAHRYQGV